jgi:hypothetical protein
MVPPFGALQTPLGKWHIVKIFDSASQCQSYRDALVVAVGKAPKSNTAMAYETRSKGSEFFDAAAAQCVATDDPRLKEK